MESKEPADADAIKTDLLNTIIAVAGTYLSVAILTYFALYHIDAFWYVFSISAIFWVGYIFWSTYQGHKLDKELKKFTDGS